MKAQKSVIGSATAVVVLLVVGLLSASGDFSSGDGTAVAALAAAPTNTGRPTISGTARAGQTLTTSKGTWSGSGTITYAYQWQRCNASGTSCGNIPGATASTYKLVSGDVGSTIGSSVTATNADGSATAYSNLAGPVAPEGSAPAYTRQPKISGNPKEGAALFLNRGAWSGSTPITFSYEWLRCDSAGKNCEVIGGATRTSYRLTAADVGRTILAAVKAQNAFGTQVGFTAPTAVIAGGASLMPKYTVQPTISGTAQVGQTLTVSNGTWSGATPITFSYQWQRCDSGGRGCNLVAGATTQSYKLTSADAGHTLLVGVIAKNSYGTQTGFTAPTGLVAVAAGQAVPVSSVSLPNRLVVGGVLFSPRVITPGTPSFTGRFRVTDSNGHPVSGAMVYAIGLPYGRVSNAPEAVTDTAGYATISFATRARISARRGYIVFFVRARKPGESLLAGVSTRRLVQVTTGR